MALTPNLKALYTSSLVGGARAAWRVRAAGMRDHHEERTMKRLGLALALLLLAALCSAQDAPDFRPASTNVWDAQYPRVDSRGGSRSGSRRPTPRRSG